MIVFTITLHPAVDVLIALDELIDVRETTFRAITLYPSTGCPYPCPRFVGAMSGCINGIV